VIKIIKVPEQDIIDITIIAISIKVKAINETILTRFLPQRISIIANITIIKTNIILIIKNNNIAQHSPKQFPFSPYPVLFQSNLNKLPKSTPSSRVQLLQHIQAPQQLPMGKSEFIFLSEEQHSFFVTQNDIGNIIKNRIENKFKYNIIGSITSDKILRFFGVSLIFPRK
jgi:hypothetical protein